MQVAASQILVEPVPEDEVSNYGIVDCMGESLCPGDSKPITRVVEKPKKEEAPSNLSINIIIHYRNQHGSILNALSHTLISYNRFI